MIAILASFYLPAYATTLVYMLQSTEYRVWPYLKWYWRTQNFSKVMHRHHLESTRPARLLLWTLRLGMALQLMSGIACLVLWRWHGFVGGLEFGLALILSYPIVWAHLITVPLLIGRLLVIRPRERLLVRQSKQVFAKHSAAKIAILGSYGKTSMKELLLTVLSAGHKKVAATPANQNVSTSHARFAQALAGDEDILLIEFGEGAPGDVARFASTTHPHYAIITGLAPAHLDRYKSLQAAGQDIFSITRYIEPHHICVNDESTAVEAFMTPDLKRYNRAGALGWQVNKVKVSIEGLSFTLSRPKHTLRLTSHLVGAHHVGPLSLVAALAHEFGLSDKEIIAGVAQTAPFEHRMQPYQLNDAWIIDDTYNGNIEGIRAGTALLKELPAKRKLYVTPGLVDQGPETKTTHQEMGRLIAASGAHKVVLMQNSVTGFIEEGLRTANFQGEITIEQDPLYFYTNLRHFVAAGDLVLLQNDWPDSYN